MNALDHYRKGERLLAEAERKSAMGLEPSEVPAYALLTAQAHAHFEAAQTLIAALSALDMPDVHDYDAWTKVARTPRKSAGAEAREFEDVDDSCEECETKGRNCAAHGGRPGIPAGGESRG